MDHNDFNVGCVIGAVLIMVAIGVYLVCTGLYGLGWELGRSNGYAEGWTTGRQDGIKECELLNPKETP